VLPQRTAKRDEVRRLEREAAQRRTAERIAAHRELVALEATGDSAGALALAERLSAQYPEGEKIAVSTCRLAKEWERWDLAFAALAAVPERIGQRASVRMARASLHMALEDHEPALAIFDELRSAWPEDVAVLREYVLTLIDLGRFDEAERLIEDLAGRGADVRKLDQRRRDAIFDTDGALDIARELCDASPDDVGRRVDLCWRLLRSLEQDLEETEAIARELEAEVGQLPSGSRRNRRVLQLLVEVAVRRKDVDAVEALLGDVPADWRYRWLFSARSWVAAMRGEPIEVVRRTWEELERFHFVPQVRPCADGELVAIGDSSIPTDVDEIRVFTVVRNERWRLPWFLDYYRSIGVDRFFFVDNDSNDGTREFLLSQSDVHVFHTSESYSLGRSGMVWVNHLVAEYGTLGWNMYVDVDEALVFPRVDDLGLRGLTGYMDDHGHEVIAGHMLDMHAPDVPELDEDGFERDFIGRYAHFDPLYRTASTIECPYFRVRGGVRRLLGSMPEQTKTPLFKAGRNIRMLASSHVITPAVVSDVRCVLLHYKLAGDYRATFRADVEENSRRPFCRRRHLGYLEALESFDDGHPDLTSDVTRRYESWRTLHELGFISAPASFLADGQ
jgi:tetratricopeptide (TPR) repeat protein